NGVLVPHFFTRYPEASQLYYNATVHEIRDVSPSFIYTRFAWTVFPLLVPFLLTGASIHLALRVKAEDRTADHGVRYNFVYGNGNIFTQGRGSRRKRRRKGPQDKESLADDAPAEAKNEQVLAQQDARLASATHVRKAPDGSGRARNREVKVVGGEGEEAD